jgi:hypothetical protein
VQAYWLDLEFGKKKKSPLRPARKRPRRSRAAAEGDYIAGEDGNVFVLRTTYSSETAAQRAAAAKWQQLNAAPPNLI